MLQSILLNLEDPFFTLFLPNKKAKHFILAELLGVLMSYRFWLSIAI